MLYLDLSEVSPYLTELIVTFSAAPSGDTPSQAKLLLTVCCTRHAAARCAASLACFVYARTGSSSGSSGRRRTLRRFAFYIQLCGVFHERTVSDSSSGCKRKRKFIALDQKAAIIRAVASGTKKTQVARDFGIAPSTLSTIQSHHGRFRTRR
ncbi:hypothetical protein HPB48_017891 [Haemaphysalis longicornis]|uniref:HTH psq-type domain-containing protein n=1 Tax=Haemaphysalis longicornis TaxID=44386 RepID=A0A9J6GPB1_HAELO|nr:hypothetical protein HPB48_017891 [Haemaphysalis longicornis]